MIKITHMSKGDEETMAKAIDKFLKSIYSNYYELKVYGNGANTKPTLKFTNKSKKELVYRCTNCKKDFNTLNKGYEHFKKSKHTWGGLEFVYITSKKTSKKVKKVGKRN